MAPTPQLGDARGRPASGADRPRRRLPGFVRRRPALAVLCLLAALLLVVVGGWAWYLNSQLSGMPRFEADFDRPERPPRTQPAEALTVLLVGVDGRGDDVRQQIEDGVYGVRSDTIMLWHLSADRESSQVVSVPRDSWVDIPGHGRAKVNAAFSWGGPELLVHTLEDTFDTYIDHAVVVDFEGFREITRTLGGVEVAMPEGSTERLEGNAALDYVRARTTLPRGDFDRIDRQQHFIRSVLQQASSTGTIANPVTVTGLVGDLGKLLVLDDDFSNGELRSLGLGVARRGGLRDVTWMTTPHDGTDTVDGQSIVRLDQKRSRALLRAISRDRFEEYRESHEIDGLPPADDVP